MAELIKKIDIKSFRGIRNLQLEELMPINILTGDNNCGKTSVLEILESYSEPYNFATWDNLVRKDNKQIVLYGLSYYEGFYNLFDINSEKKELKYSVQTGDENVEVCLSAREVIEEVSEEKFNNIQGYRPINDDIIENTSHMLSKMEMQIEINGDKISEDSVYEGQRRVIRNQKIIRAGLKGKNVIYISPIRHAEGNLFLNEVLDNPDLYEEMLAVLKEYDEDIISINYDSNDNGNARGVYKILSKSHKKALPLNVYGDGMKKAILLMSAVVKAQNGILLLDEFETAIHTSAMSRTFRWILDTCMKLNVQVFLTSHSQEAIDKVLKCSSSLVDKIAVYTLYKDRGGNSVRRLTGRKAIEVQDNMGLELR